MSDMSILQPAVGLLIWTMVMWAWMYVTRIPAMSKLKVAPNDVAMPRSLDDTLPANVQSKAHNYNHLHEQPTVFYATAIILAITGQGHDIPTLLAWIYVGLRVAHSLVQATANVVMVRFVLFALSSLILIALIFHAAVMVFDA